METSIFAHVSPELPLILSTLPVDAPALAAAPAPAPVALDYGGAALGLDPNDDLEPQWLAWGEWVDGLVTAPASSETAPVPELVALDDGGPALGLDSPDDLEPQWLAWNEWVEVRDARRAGAPRVGLAC